MYSRNLIKEKCSNSSVFKHKTCYGHKWVELGEQVKKTHSHGEKTKLNYSLLSTIQIQVGIIGVLTFRILNY